VKTSAACLTAFSLMAIATASATLLAAAPARIPAADGIERSRVLDEYGQLPIRFEENRGQVDPAVKYVARGADRTIFLTPSEIVMSLRMARNAPKSVRMKFHGTRGATAVTGEDPADTRSNYYIGNNPTAWHRDVANFSKVRYHDVYPGVDVVYYGTSRQLEYDFVVAPNADPERIDLSFDGVDSVTIARNGDLVLQTPAGPVVHRKPVAYLPYAGGRTPVEARYVKRASGGVGIALANYDHGRQLVIDPFVVFYSTYLGGSAADKALSILVDGTGNTYVAGLTQSIDFPTANAAQPVLNGATDVFISKINASGTALVYSTYLGGSDIDAASGIARDAAGNVYVTGYTASSNFPVTANALQSSLNGTARDAFVAKLGTSGALQYSTYLGGSNLDVANAIAVDSAGNAYVTGYTCSPDFPVVNAFQPFLKGGPYGCFSGWDAFLSKLDASGTALVYSTYFGGFSQDEAKAIAVDAAGRAHITGYTWSDDLPTAGSQLSAYRGSADPFVSRFSATGGLDYATYFAGTGHDEGSSIALDAGGALYVAGYTQSVDFPTVNAFQTDLHGPEDGFVFKLALDSSANAVVAYSSYLGGRDYDRSRAIALDRKGTAHVTGFTASLDFPLVLPTQSMLNGTQDAFVVRINDAGALIYSTFLGGNDLDDGWAIALGSGTIKAAGNIYVAGTTYSTDFSTNGVLQPIQQGSLDGFVTRLSYVP
jgi:hypothetical protein